MSFTRRSVLTAGGGALALASCTREAESAAPAKPAAAQGLKAYAPFPVGAAINTGALTDPAYAALVRRHFDQVTADWEMKMETVLRDDGSYDWTKADRIAGFARENGLRLFGHTLIWNEQRPAYFERLKGDRRAFEAAFARYVADVAGRYRGVVGWDVVNEAFNWNGSERQGGVWAEALGQAYIPLTFRHARAADPAAVLFLNDYGLEQYPEKRRAFLALAEDLLKAGAPLGGLGTQTHLNRATDPAAIGPAMRELGSLGLPVHVSEIDMTLKGTGRDRAAALQLQGRLVGAAAEAFAALPERQRFAFTAWGVRDGDSWLRREPKSLEFPGDQPMLLDDQGAPKPAFIAAAEAWR